MTLEEFQELLPFYALGTLTTDEAWAMDAFLTAHPEQHTELQAWQDTLAALALTVEPKTPPHDLLEQIQPYLHQSFAPDTILLSDAPPSPVPVRTRKKTPAPPPDASNISNNSSNSNALNTLSDMPPAKRPAIRAEIATPETAPPPAPHDPTPTKTPVDVSRNFWPLALCLILLLALLGLGWAYGRLREENRALKEQLRSVQSEQTAALSWQREVLGPDGHGMSLHGTRIAPQARARLAYSSQSGQASFIVHSLPSAPAGQSYQVWFISRGQAIAGQTFNTNAQGIAQLNFRFPHNGLTAETFAVTLESANGATQPQGPQYFAQPLS